MQENPSIWFLDKLEKWQQSKKYEYTENFDCYPIEIKCITLLSVFNFFNSTKHK